MRTATELTSSPPPEFAVSQFTTWHLTFEQDIELYQRLGISAMELCERKLSTNSEQARRQLQKLKDAGIRVCSVQPRVHALFRDSMCPELVEPEARMEEFRKTIDWVSREFPGQNLPLVTLTGAAPNRNFRRARDTAMCLYPALADYAAERGVRLMLEPLHPMFMNTDTFICSLRDARQLVEAINRENFGLAIDVFHIFHEPGIAQRLAELIDRIFAAHLSDWPTNHPRMPADRLLPGDGCIDLPAIFSGIAKSGYRDAYTLEIFSSDELPDSLWRQDPADVIQRGRNGFLSAWNQREQHA